jgi:glucose-1-phosphate thymidylyltransferase
MGGGAAGQTVKRGIVLAGGTGARLRPLTTATSKQLLPVFDKPMVYYALSALLLSGVREILVITTPRDEAAFRALLRDGSHLGIALTFAVQATPAGIADALRVGRGFLDGAPCVLVLGDNLLYGQGLRATFQQLAEGAAGGRAGVLGVRVADARRYGVLALDGERVVGVVEKPDPAPSPWAVPGFYALPSDAAERAASQRPSARGELEITDVLATYIAQGRLDAVRLGRGVAWLDMGTPERLADASAYVRALQERTGLLVGSPEEVAWRQGLIDDAGLLAAAEAHRDTSYGAALAALLQEGRWA